MSCDLHVEDIDNLIKDLNKYNDLFKFVRIMREKFQTAALNGKNLLSLFNLFLIAFNIVVLFSKLITVWEFHFI